MNGNPSLDRDPGGSKWSPMKEKNEEKFMFEEVSGGLKGSPRT